ncbi:MAG: CPBP family glutamic-type intramembrane protease [Phycisphaeraceae bacterium]
MSEPTSQDVAERDEAPANAGGALAAFDAWMASNPWHPRIVPFAAYLLLLAVIDFARGWWLPSYPLLYAVQIAVVAWLLWRYRKLLPELTLRFHWLAVPTGLGLCVVWVALGYGMIALAPGWFDGSGEAHYFQTMRAEHGWVFYVSMVLRLAGMAMLVPLFEELFIRSACLRGLHSAKQTKIGLVQLAEDMPLIGERILHTRIAQEAASHPPAFTQQLRDWPVGALTVFGVIASTFIFMIHHLPRDWPGTIACGVLWCGLLWYTNRGGRRMGLGPIVWSHGITNAALWAYCWHFDDWQFL